MQEQKSQALLDLQPKLSPYSSPVKTQLLQLNTAPDGMATTAGIRHWHPLNSVMMLLKTESCGYLCCLQNSCSAVFASLSHLLLSQNLGHLLLTDLTNNHTMQDSPAQKGTKAAEPNDNDLLHLKSKKNIILSCPFYFLNATQICLLSTLPATTLIQVTIMVSSRLWPKPFPWSPTSSPASTLHKNVSERNPIVSPPFKTLQRLSVAFKINSNLVKMD